MITESITKDKIKQLHQHHDSELSENDRAELLRQLDEDSELHAEAEWLEAFGKSYRKDSSDQLEKVNFNNFSLSVLQKIEEKEQKTGIFSLFKRLYNKPVLVIGFAFSVLVLCFVSASYLKTTNVNSTIDFSGSNDCIVERIENKKSSSIVFKTDDKENPVTVIWLFEDQDKS